MECTMFTWRNGPETAEPLRPACSLLGLAQVIYSKSRPGLACRPPGLFSALIEICCPKKKFPTRSYQWTPTYNIALGSLVNSFLLSDLDKTNVHQLWLIHLKQRVTPVASELHVSQSVIPLSLIFKESWTYCVAYFGVQRQSGGVSGIQPLQVLESMAWRLKILRWLWNHLLINV
jgi:hypothetical protein